jgi:pseudouridine synthase
MLKDFLSGVKTRVYPVGRLDYDSEGLLFLTNDGELAQTLIHPRHGIPRTYLVKVKGALSDQELLQLEKGVRLPDGRLVSCRIRKLQKTQANSWLEVTLYEGLNRQIRKMMEKVGHPVLKLKRIRLATLELGDLSAGRYRHLSVAEIQELRRYVKESPEGPGQPRVKRGRVSVRAV